MLYIMQAKFKAISRYVANCLFFKFKGFYKH